MQQTQYFPPGGTSSGSVATDTIWDAAGDLVEGTGPDAAVRVPIGAPGTVLTVNAGGNGVEWDVLPGGGDMTTNTAQNVTGIKTFVADPVFNNAAIPEAKVANLVTDLAAKATDTLVVHLAGAESITGAKTFSTDPVFNNAAIPEAKVANLVTDLAAKATDTLVVHLAGAETISGVKTFSADPVFVSGATPTTIVANTQTANYQLVAGDAGKVVEMNVAGANTLTIPTNATVAFPVGTIIEIYQMGAGQCTVTAAGGVTLRAPRGAKTAVQFSTVAIRQRAANEWVLTGDCTT